MKKEDFKEITEKHIEMAIRIIKSNGSCENVPCEDCPFSDENSIEPKICYTNRTSDSWLGKAYVDEKFLKSAREFLEICGRTASVIGEGTIDKSTSLEIQEDKINSPKHYRLPGLNIESIDIIRAILGKYFKWFCLGNIIKYILRAEKKNGLEDYKKARKYLDWLIKGEEK